MDLQQVFKPENSEYKRVHEKNPGLFEFLDSQYIIDYDPTGTNMDEWSSYLKRMWTDGTHQRDIIIHTGEGGMKLFNEMIKEEYGK